MNPEVWMIIITMMSWNLITETVENNGISKYLGSYIQKVLININRKIHDLKNKYFWTISF